MAFRIRDLEGDAEEHLYAERVYRDHLGQFCKRSNPDFWKFFYWDFFHDGQVQDLRVSPDFRTLEIKLLGPNIRKHEGDDFEYVTAGFTVRFQGLRWLHLEPESPFGNELSQPLQFRYGEINTHPAIHEVSPSDGEPGPLSSLLIEFFGDSSTWFEVIFEQVEVTPDEPVAFALMEADSRFTMPTYRLVEQ